MNFELYDTLYPITEKGFGRVYDILAASLPQEEMRTMDEQKKLLEKDAYKLLTATKNGEIIGFIAMWDLGSYNFIEHFAISDCWRNKGIGGNLLEYCKGISGKTIILEVELPGSTSEADRRIEFYKRHGFSFNNFEYYQPPLQTDYEILPLRIMSYPCALTENEFSNVRDILYTQVYDFFEKRLDKTRK